MGKWSNENKSCKTTWLTLKMLNQHDSNFDQTGIIKMKDLTFWNSAASDEIRKIQVKTISIEIDNIFRSEFGAEYESTSNKSKSLEDMQSILLIAEKTVNDLASKNDENYKFYKEIT